MFLKCNVDIKYDGNWTAGEKRYFEKHWVKLYQDYVDIVNPKLERINADYDNSHDEFDWERYHVFLRNKLAPFMAQYNAGPDADRRIRVSTDSSDGLPQFLLRNGRGKAKILIDLL